MATAIGSMTGVSVSSPFFTNKPTLELFPQNPKSATSSRIALMYGKNGSGKSTIAQGFREYRNSINPRTVTLTPLAGSSYISISPSGKPEKFFIFDEEYITSRVKISDKNGLDAIVLFGEQVSLEEKIKAIVAEIECIKETEKIQIENYKKYTDINDVNAPSHWIAKIESSLGKGQKKGWAATGSQIKGQRQNLSVDLAVINRIGRLTPTQTEQELKSEFCRQYTLFNSTSSQSTILNHKIINISIVGNIELNAEGLLGRIISKPQLTKREQEIMGVFGIDLTGLINARDFLSDGSRTICNRCLQPINESYRLESLEQIKNILNREVEEFQTEIKKLLINPIDATSYQAYNVLNKTSYDAVQSSLITLNIAIEAHNRQIQQKIANPYDVLAYDKSNGILAACDTANLALTALEAERITYNETIQERKTAMQSLLELNDAIAHFAIVSDYASLNAQHKAEKDAKDALKTTSDQIAELEKKKNQLDAERKNFQIAADEINRSLEYIFFSKERLSLELGSDHLYHLKAHGHPVEPNKVSCGERNALALCYFFTEISKDMDAKSVYADEVFLIIDDPVSSFDLENRIGILSFMRWKIKQVLDGCATTKLFIMTHDISVMFDMQKSLNEIFGYKQRPPKESLYHAFHLENRQLAAFDYGSHEYTHLLEKIFIYAKQATSDAEFDLVIGNMMRRVLEAFSTFSFKRGIADVSTDEVILGLLPDDGKRMYFQNLMYRLVLHGESHFEEYLKGAPETSFFTHLSATEKQRTAQNILCFIFLLNKAHILAHLPDAEQDISTWCANLPNT
nr:MAG TPA: AAA domain protein [Caudoviricetes sp.]